MRSFLTFVCSSALAAATAMAAPTSNVASYPLSTCIVSGETLDDGAVSKQYDGREVRFCCEKCIKTFESDQATHLKKLDDAIIAAQMDAYPLVTCVVSGEELGGEMGDPKNVIVGNRLVRLCCNMCKKDLNTDPAAFIAKLDAAVVAAQTEAYPATTCPISGEELGGMGDPYDYVYAGRLVRFCCGGCIDSFNANPSVAMEMIYGDANVAAEPHHDGSAHDAD